MKLMSGVYTVNQNEYKVVILDSEDMNVAVVYANLVFEEGVSGAIKRGDHEAIGSVVDGDTIVLSKDQERVVYTIAVAHGWFSEKLGKNLSQSNDQRPFCVQKGLRMEV